MKKARFYFSENTLIIHNHERKLNNVVREAADDIKVDICATDCMTDLIAVPAFMAIINPDSLKPKDMPEFNSFLDYLIETGDVKVTGILFLKKPSFTIVPKLRKFIVKTPENLDRESLRLIMLNRRSAYRRRRNATTSCDKKIFRLMKMILILKDRKTLKVDELMSEFNVSSKTIKRDLILIETLGYLHKYDIKKKGYVTVFNPE